MTALMETAIQYARPEWTPERLRKLPPEDFRTLVTGKNVPADLWERLIGAEFRPATAAALASSRDGVYSQIADRRARLRKMDQNSPRYAPAKAEFDEWHGRVTRYLESLKYRVTMFERATGLQVGRAPADDTQGAQLSRALDALYALGGAIAEHRAASEAEGCIPEPYDETLWATLGEVTLLTRDGDKTIAAYIGT